MRALLIAILTGLALWRAWIDWQATIGAGYAFRLTPLGRVLEARWPEWYASLSTGGAEGGVLATTAGWLMAVPLALIPAALALALWLTRRRRSR